MINLKLDYVSCLYQLFHIFVERGEKVLKLFSVENFKNLNVDQLKFKRINILIGPNNSGKSNLIDAISFFPNIILNEIKGSAFLAEIAKHNWDDVLNRKLDKPGEINFKWVLNTDSKYPDLTYSLRFKVSTPDQIPKGFYIIEEKLRYDKPSRGQAEPFEFIHCHGKYPGQGNFSVKDSSQKAKRVTLNVDIYDTVFRQTSALLDSNKFRMTFYPNFNETVRSVQRFFEGFYSYSGTEFNMKEIRQPVEIKLNEKYLNRIGTNFVNVLNYLNDNYDFLDQYTDLLRELIPGLERVKISHVSQSNYELQLRIKNDWFKLNEMSDGTIKAMLMTLLLWSPEKMGIIALDEPELNLHPAWLKVMTNWIIQLRSTEQIFLSSHSPDFLDGFTSSFQQGETGVYVFNLDQTESIKLLMPEQIREFLQEGWEIGDLYRVGEPLLGGWPW